MIVGPCFQGVSAGESRRLGRQVAVGGRQKKGYNAKSIDQLGVRPKEMNERAVELFKLGGSLGIKVRN